MVRTRIILCLMFFFISPRLFSSDAPMNYGEPIREDFSSDDYNDSWESEEEDRGTENGIAVSDMHNIIKKRYLHQRKNNIIAYEYYIRSSLRTDKSKLDILATVAKDPKMIAPKNTLLSMLYEKDYAFRYIINDFSQKIAENQLIKQTLLEQNKVHPTIQEHILSRAHENISQKRLANK